MRRMFIERVLFGDGGRMFTWRVTAGIVWLGLGFCSILPAFALVMTFWYAGGGLAILVLGVVFPLWFAHKLLYREGAFWVAAAMVYGCAVLTGIVINAHALDGSLVYVLAAGIPTIASAFALWEMHRVPMPKRG